MKKFSFSKVAMLVMGFAAFVGLAISAGALNGGTALTAGSFDSIVTTLKGYLASTMVISFALMALLASVWQIMHGRGYATLSVVLLVMLVAIVGPTIITGISTTVRVPHTSVAVAQHVPATATLFAAH